MAVRSSKDESVSVVSEGLEAEVEVMGDVPPQHGLVNSGVPWFVDDYTTATGQKKPGSRRCGTRLLVSHFNA
jgi:hypothetical protein